MKPILYAVAGLVVGVWVGRWSATGPELAPAAPIAAPERAPTEAWPLPADLPACQDELALARAVLAAQERERVGVPVPFPENLPAIYTPAGFEGAVRQALAECPQAEVELARVDCSEYPCFASFLQPTGGMNHAIQGLLACPGWTSRFDNPRRGQGNTSFMTDEGPVEWSYVIPTPADVTVEDQENAGKRWQLRFDETEEALMNSGGGRPFTELERLDQQLDFWEEHADQVGEEATADIVAELRARRAKVEAQEQRATSP
jgi:hypothetical protein